MTAGTAGAAGSAAFLAPDPSVGVSVVVPVYNAGRYLERCITSLLRQTLPATRYEVIFVDDGSTDGSGARLDSIAAEHPELVRVLHTPNSGWPGRPRNLGTDEARREYVFYCDADDWLPEYALAMLADRAERDSSDIVVARRMGVRSGPNAVFERGDYCTTWRETPAVFHTLTCHKLFRSRFLRDQGIRFPEGKVRLEDYIFMVQAYLKAERISVLGSRPTYVLERREDRANLTATKADEDDFWGSVERIIELITGLTAEGRDRDVALDRIVRSEVIGTVTGRAHLAKPEDVRIQSFDLARRLMTHRIPSSAVARLGVFDRRRAVLIVEGDRIGLEHLAAWYVGVKAKGSATEVSWRDGRLVLTMEVQLERDGDALRCTRAGDRILLRTPAHDGSPAGDASQPGDGDHLLDVTAELARSTVHVVLREPLLYEDRRVRASVRLDPGEETTSGSVRWTATAEIDPLTAAGGNPLREAEWDLHVAVASCGWRLMRSLVVPAELPIPPPAVLGPASPVVIPFRRGRTRLSLDVGPVNHSVAAEVAGRGVGHARLDGPELTVPLPIVAGGEAPVQVQLRSSSRRTPSSRVTQGRILGSGQGSTLRLPLDAVPQGSARWSLSLALGDPPAPLGVAVSRRPAVGPRIHENRARQLALRMCRVLWRRLALRMRPVAWRRLAVRALARVGVHGSDLRAVAALVRKRRR